MCGRQYRAAAVPDACSRYTSTSSPKHLQVAPQLEYRRMVLVRGVGVNVGGCGQECAAVMKYELGSWTVEASRRGVEMF